MLITVPVTPTRDQAQSWAQHEVSRAEYHAEDPNWWGRFTQAVRREVQNLLDRLFSSADGHTPTLWLAIVLILVFVIIVIAVIIWRVGGLRRQAQRAGGGVFADQTLTAADYRRRADQAADRGEWATAVTERYRAVAREAEQRQWVLARPGRTADETAHEVGRRLPALAHDFRAASRFFDAVVYGGREADRAQHDRIANLDEALRRAAPRSAGPGATDPEATDPEATDPRATAPEATAPEATEPAPASPEPPTTVEAPQ